MGLLVTLALFAVPERVHAQQINPLCVSGCQGTILVTPDGATTAQQSNATNLVATFDANHIGTGGGAFTFSCSKTGSLTCVSVNPTSASLIGQDVSVTVQVTYNVGATGGVLTLTATGPSGTDAGTISVTTPGKPGARLVDTTVANVDRGLCLTLGAGESAGLSCGDLFVVAGMPAYRTLGRDRSPALYYNSAAANALVLVPARLQEATTTTMPTSIAAVLRLGTKKDSVQFTTPTTNDSQQVVLGRGITGVATGYYLDSLTISNVYPTMTRDSTIRGKILVLNRSNSEYGRGWSLLGVEQVLPVSWDTTKRVWVAGDGSMRVFSKDSAADTVYRAAPGDAPDSLIAYRHGTPNPTWWYVRLLKHGAQVHFDETGAHRETRNRFGAVTTFSWGLVPVGTSSVLRLLSIAVPPNDVLHQYQLTWDAAGMLKAISDPGGRQLQTVVSGGKLLKVIAPDLRDTTRFVYDAAGRMTERHTPRQVGSTKGDSAITKYAYASGARVTSISIQADSLASKWQSSTYSSWDEQGLASLYRITDSFGVPSRFDGPLTGTADAVDFWVNRFGQPRKTVQVGLSLMTQMWYDSSKTPGLATKIQYPHPTTSGVGGRVVRMDWNARGNLALVTDSTKAFDGRGNKTTTYTYSTTPNFSAPDSPTQVRDPLGRITAYNYDALGVLSSILDSRNHATHFWTRSTGPLTGVMDSVVEQQVTTWEQSSATTKVLDQATAFWYDGLGNVTVTRDPAGALTVFTNDNVGRVQDLYNPLKVRTSFYYDQMNRVYQQVTYTTPSSLPVEITELANCVSSQVVCSAQAWSIDSLPSQLTPTAIGQGVVGVDSVVDPRDVRRRYHYDARGLLRREVDDSLRTMTSFFSTAGLLDSTRTRESGVTRYVYDAYGRLSSKWFSPDTQNFVIPGDTVSNTYDLLGRVLTSSNRTGVITRSYWADGSLRTQVTTVRNAAPVDSVRFSYDSSGARTGLYHSSLVNVGGSRPLRDSVTYSYNTGGDLSAVSVLWDNSGGATPAWSLTRAFGFSWDELGRRSSVTYPFRQMSVSYSYDIAGRLRRVKDTTFTAPSGNSLGDIFVFSALDTLVDVAGRVVQRSVHCNRASTAPGSECTGTSSNNDVISNQYNWLSMLTWQGTTPGTRVQMNRYDASGNLIWRQDSTGAVVEAHQFIIDYGHNALKVDRQLKGLVLYPDFYMTTDSNGSRRIEGTLGGGQPAGRAYYYDATGRMTGLSYSALDGIGSAVINAPDTCRYDADGQVAMACDGSPWIAYDGANVAYTYTAASGFQMLQGEGVDNPLMSYGYTGIGWREYYYVTDGHGSQLAVGTSDGDLVDADKTSSSRKGWQWAGGTGNAATFQPSRMSMYQLPAISLFRNRAYDQRSGRWTQEDPIGVAGGLNLYQYNGNNPVAFTDPFGLCPPQDHNPNDCTQQQRDAWEGGHITFASGTSWKGVDKRLHRALVNTSIILDKRLYVSSTNNPTDRHAPKSLHYVGRAVDISRVDDQRIANDKTLAGPVQNTMLDQLGDDVAELFGPDWLYKSNGMTGTEGIFAEHQNHVHVGVKGPVQEE